MTNSFKILEKTAEEDEANKKYPQIEISRRLQLLDDIKENLTKLQRYYESDIINLKNKLVYNISLI